MIATLDRCRLCLYGHDSLWALVRRNGLLLRLLLMSAGPGLGLLHVPHSGFMLPLDVSDLVDSVFAIPSIESHHQLGDQVRMLRGLLHRWKARRRRLALPRAGRSVPMCSMLSITIELRL